MLCYSISLMIFTLIISVWSRVKYSNAMIQPNYDLYHIIPRNTLDILSKAFLVLFIASTILFLVVVNERIHVYNINY